MVRVMATVRQIKAVANVVENGGIVSKGMIQAGYSPATAKNPDKLTKSKGWMKLMQQHISDTSLAKRHHEQLNSSKLTKLYFDANDGDDLIAEVCKKLGVELLFVKLSKDKKGKTANVKAPDFFFRDLALDKAYKLKGRYMKDGDDSGTKVLIINMIPDANARYAASISRSPEANSDGQTQV